jgi:hypothetical protein
MIGTYLKLGFAAIVIVSVMGALYVVSNIYLENGQLKADLTQAKADVRLAIQSQISAEKETKELLKKEKIRVRLDQIYSEERSLILEKVQRLSEKKHDISKLKQGRESATLKVLNNALKDTVLIITGNKP